MNEPLDPPDDSFEREIDDLTAQNERQHDLLVRSQKYLDLLLEKLPAAGYDYEEVETLITKIDKEIKFQYIT